MIFFFKHTTSPVLQDEYKLVVIEAIQSLCPKYPRKHRSFISFLSSSLREEGGIEYKRAIVDCLLHIVHVNEEVKELGLLHLSEFIEDCEYTQLSTHILHVLGEHGPTTREPSKFIRYIYNRLFLENAAIRAAAVSALTHFGLKCPALRGQLSILLIRCIHDSDDEVRDRATLFRNWLEEDENHPVPCIKAVFDVESALEKYLQSAMTVSFKIADVKFHELSRRDVKLDAASETSAVEERVHVLEFKANGQFSNLGSDFLVIFLQ